MYTYTLEVQRLVSAPPNSKKFLFTQITVRQTVLTMVELDFQDIYIYIKVFGRTFTRWSHL